MDASVNRREMRRVLLSGLIGTTIEWYDFFLYGTMSALVFNKLFFPHLDPATGTLASFGTFAAGFLTRPLGSLIMGHFGDRLGRKTTLVASLSLMGLSTVAIGLLPTYNSIGLAAPVLLTACRVIQGFALGGEWSGAVTLVFEHAPTSRRARHGQWVQAGALAGILLSNLTVLLLSINLTNSQFLDWGWRIPFLVSGLLLVVGLFVRLRVVESPVFKQMAQANEQARVPVIAAVRTHWWAILRVTGMHLIVTTLTFVSLAFVLSYAITRAGFTRTEMLEVICVGALVAGLCIPLFARAGDLVGRRTVYLVGALAAAALAFPAFRALDTGTFVGGVAAVDALIVPSMAMYTTQGAWFPELFPAQLRVTGAGLGVQLATVILGGPAPTIAQALMRASHGHTWSVAAYVSGVALVSAVFVLCTPETLPARSAKRA
ncbi:MAG TPA: MFS transporter [Sporichthyaceae bacterium]|nr:MFS transporter [Sporichthyaceae bacterium]